MFLEYTPSGPAFTNCILLACSETKKAAIIDAPAGIADQLLARIDEMGFEVQMILLTHSHWDHTADVAALKEKTGAPLYVHELDSENVRHPGADGLPMMIPIEPAQPDRLLKGGEQLTLGALTIDVIHTPGHSPGCVCFYLKENATLISGDTLFNQSIGRLDLPTSNATQMWTSLEKLAKLPPETHVYPGHGDDTTLREQAWLSDAKHYFGG